MYTIERSRLQSASRAAAVTLLTEYAAAASVKLQVYPGRPKSLFPPTAFVDRITEDVSSFTVTTNQRDIRVEVMVVFGDFDSKEAVAQKDDFVDEFLDWVTDRYHAAGANTTIRVAAIEDEPAWQPDWRPANKTNGPDAVYYATRLILEGFAGG